MRRPDFGNYDLSDEFYKEITKHDKKAKTKTMRFLNKLHCNYRSVRQIPEYPCRSYLIILINKDAIYRAKNKLKLPGAIGNYLVQYCKNLYQNAKGYRHDWEFK